MNLSWIDDMMTRDDKKTVSVISPKFESLFKFSNR